MERNAILTGAALTALALAGCAHQHHVAKAADAAPVKGECHGVNACKGQGVCAGPGYECAGNNACKGQGWLSLTKSDCAAKGGTYKGG
jgi:uncharacterized membrane protein